MAHLLGILVSDPDLLRCQLRRLRGRAHLGAGETLGLGYFADGDVLFAKRPASDGSDLASLGEELRSPALVAAGLEDAAGFDENATDPFRFRRWLFAMDGAIEHFGELRPAMLAAMPPFVGRQILSSTDREHVFGIFLAELKAAGRLDDADVPAPDAARCLAQTIRAIDRIAREKDHQTRPAPLAIVASNGRLLLAARRGRPLHYALLEGMASCELCAIDDRTPHGDPSGGEHRRSKAVAIAGAPTTGGSFIEVPESSTVAVGRALDITVASI